MDTALVDSLKALDPKRPIREATKLCEPAKLREGSQADSCTEQNPVYSMTSSARASNVDDTVRLRALAVLRLMINSNLVALSTGTSVGLVPFKILSTNIAARRYMFGTFTP